jgi:cytochrome P450
MTESVVDLDLPELDISGMDRKDALDAALDAGRHHWLARSPLGSIITGHDDAMVILRERHFHSALSLIPRMSGVEAGEYLSSRRPSILSMEGDGHARLRRLVAPAFTPASADRLRPFMRQVVEDLVTAVAPSGRCELELVADVREPYPVPIICELLGAPEGDWRRFSSWATDIFRIFNRNLVDDLPAIARASAEPAPTPRATSWRARSPSLPAIPTSGRSWRPGPSWRRGQWRSRCDTSVPSGDRPGGV